MKSLIKGQRVRLSDLTHNTAIQLHVSIQGPKDKLGFYCLALDAQGKLLNQQYVMHVGHKQSPCQSIIIQEQLASNASFGVQLGTLPEGTKELIFAVSIGDSTGCLLENASDISEGFLALKADGQELARYSFSAQDFTGEKALVLGRLYLKDIWRFGVDGSGFRGGLAAFLQHYGVAETSVRAVEEPEPAPAAGLQLSKIILPSGWPGTHSPRLPQDIIQGVGLLLVENRDGTKTTGTGFVISPGGFLLSCDHVVHDAERIYICMENTNVLRPVVFLTGDPKLDIALLWISDGSGSPYWMLLAPAEDKPILGDALGLLAYPLGFDLGLSVTYSQGIVNSYRQRDNVPLLQIDAGAAPGSSGGPVFRRSDGRVVGMLQSGISSEGRGIIINLALDLRVFWSLDWSV
jgi:stress response protein SCP2